MTLWKTTIFVVFFFTFFDLINVFVKGAFMIDQKKHLLTIEKQIEHLKSKGITFDLVSEKDAFSYLQNESHFFKLIAYRKNYQKYEYGDHAGQYIHLEFGDLEDLTEIDRFLRSVLLQLQQIVSLPYVHNKIVTSEKVHQASSLLCHALDQRFFIHDYHNNSLIYESFVFLHKIIDWWF